MTRTTSGIPTPQASRRSIVKGVAGAAAAAFLAAGWTVEAAPRPALETGSAPAIPDPVKIVIVYGHPEDADAFESYFLEHHVPLARGLPLYTSIESALAVSGAEGEEASFHRVSTVTFNSEADLVASLASEAGQAIYADIANFATGGATATIVTGIQVVTPDDDVAGANSSRSAGRYEQRSPE